MLAKFNHKILISLLLAMGVLAIYITVYPSPRNIYDHYLYLAKSLTLLRVDVPNIPNWYQDTVIVNSRVLLPFPPMPAVLMIPFITIAKNITQQQVSIILGSLNIALIYLLARHFTNSKAATIVAVFLGLGTAAFWSSVVGTTWFFAHTSAIFFLTLSLLCHFNKRDYLSGLMFAASVLCRYPIAFGGIFFLLQLRKDYPRLIKFTLGALPLIPINFLYNFVRFGNFFEMGYKQLYAMYTTQNYAYSFIRIIRPDWPPFGYLDIRNIPLHAITFLVLPPIISENFTIQPSPYGMGILFTSPLLLITLIPNWKNILQRNLWLGAAAVAFVEFLHYAQGWVQFGYRFALDFMPFLLILLAIKFKFTKIFIFLFLISLIVNFWGVAWAIKLGW